MSEAFVWHVWVSISCRTSIWFRNWISAVTYRPSIFYHAHVTKCQTQCQTKVNPFNENHWMRSAQKTHYSLDNKIIIIRAKILTSFLRESVRDNMWLVTSLLWRSSSPHRCLSCSRCSVSIKTSLRKSVGKLSLRVCFGVCPLQNLAETQPAAVPENITFIFFFFSFFNVLK